MFWSPAIGEMEVLGGVCMAIAQRWVPFIIKKQEIIWGLLNVYAPNIASAQNQFWQVLLNILPPL